MFNFRFSYNIKIYKTFLIIIGVRIEIENSKEYNKGLYLFDFLKRDESTHSL